MTDLKERIKEKVVKKKCHLYEGYKTPEELGDLLLADLKEAIERDFPLLSVQGEKMEDKMRGEHENFVHQKCFGYVGRGDLFHRLRRWMRDTEGGGALICGGSGIGKSAFLANFWKNGGFKEGVTSFVHFVGSSGTSSDLSSILLRLVLEMKKLVGEDSKDVPVDEKALVELLPSLFAGVSACGRIVVIIDAVNQLLSEKDHDLWWIPSHLPPGVHIVVSSLSTSTLAEASKRKWQVIEMTPLDEDEKEQLVEKRLKMYGKRLKKEHMEKLMLHPLSSYPLFLSTVMVELCTIGFFKEFDIQFEGFVDCQDMETLFKSVIERWEDDFGQSNVSKTLCTVAVSRKGLSEEEMKGITLMNGVEWSKVMSAVRLLMVINRGLWNFCHMYLKRAVITKYGLEDATRSSEGEARQFIVEYFQKRMETTHQFTTRIAEELPWQLSRLMAVRGPPDAERCCDALIGLLLNRNNVQVFVDNEVLQYELVGYWSSMKIGREKIEEMYLEEVLRMKTEVGSDSPAMRKMLGSISSILWNLSCFSGATQVREQLISIQETCGVGGQEMADSLCDLAFLLEAQGKHNEAHSFLEQALELAKQALGPDHPDVAVILFQLGELMIEVGEYKESVTFHEEALNIKRRAFGVVHGSVALSLQSLASSLISLDRYDEGRVRLEEAMEIEKKVHGMAHPTFGYCLREMGKLLRRQGKYDEARHFIEQALAISKKAFGDVHHEVAVDLGSLGSVLKDIGELEEAKKYYEESLSIQKAIFGNFHPDVATSLNNFGVLLDHMKRLEEAKHVHEEALSIRRNLLRGDHPHIANSLHNLAGVMFKQGELETAKSLLEESLAILRKAYGDSHSEVASCLDYLGFVMVKQGDLEGAQSHFEEALAIVRRTFDGSHPDVQLYLGHLVDVLKEQGKFSEAEALEREQQGEP